MKLKHSILLIILIFCFGTVKSQQDAFKWRVGAYGGVMHYFGDLNDRFFAPNNELRDFDTDFLSYGVSIEKILSNAWSAKLLYTEGEFIANDRAIKWDGSPDVDRSNFERSLNARTDITDFSLMFTYYLDNGGLFNKRAFLAPYISFGVGVTDFEVFGDLLDASGNRYNYWSDNTIRSVPENAPDAEDAVIIEQDGAFETNLTDLDTEKDYNTKTVNIPVGIGFKFRISSRINVNLEYMARYTFTDHLDDVAGRFRETFDNGFQEYASNPTNREAEFRGNRNENNDIYTLTSLSLHYNFGKRKEKFIAPRIYASSMPDTRLRQRNVSNINPQGTVRLEVQPDSSLPHQVSFNPIPDSVMQAENRAMIVESQKMIAIDSTIVSGRGVLSQTDKQKALEDTILNLEYAVKKQRLENELYNLRRESPNPEVYLKVKEDSIRAVQRFESDFKPLLTDALVADKESPPTPRDTTAIARDTTVAQPDTATVQRQDIENRLDQMRKEMELLQQRDSISQALNKPDTVKQDTIISQSAVTLEVDSMEIESKDSLANAEKAALNERMKELERKIEAARQQDSVRQSSMANNIDSLQREIVRLEQVKSTSDEDGPVSAGEMQAMQAKIDSLQAQITKTGNRKPGEANRTNRQSEPNYSDRIDEMEQEISNLKNNKSTLENRNSLSEKESQQYEKRIAELEKEIGRLKKRGDRSETRRGSDKSGVSGQLAVQPSPEPSVDTTQNQQLAEINKKLEELNQQLTSNKPDSVNDPEKLKTLQSQIDSLQKALALTKTDENKKPIIPEFPKTEIFFNVGSSRLGIIDKKRIAEVANFVNKYPDVQLVVRGFTDKTGSPEQNLILSQRRANSVKQALLESGVTDNTIKTEYMGEDRSIQESNSVYGRRVEILLGPVK